MLTENLLQDNWQGKPEAPGEEPDSTPQHVPLRRYWKDYTKRKLVDWQAPRQV